jgi:hypothetical protein
MKVEPSPCFARFYKEVNLNLAHNSEVEILMFGFIRRLEFGIWLRRLPRLSCNFMYRVVASFSALAAF